MLVLYGSNGNCDEIFYDQQKENKVRKKEVHFTLEQITSEFSK
ncbi:hypothetical protein LEP1GSC198_2035 [Leptospira kirschneri str. JB]|nr:hypothetical protein LEP1GSC198_2035 [Leptospira kirschneri str. JB]